MNALLAYAASIMAKEAKRLAVKYATSDQPDVAQFAGKWTLTPSDNAGVFLAEIDLDDPLRLVHESGIEFTPIYRTFETDLASVPEVVQEFDQLRLKPNSFPKSTGGIHDPAYKSAAMLVRRSGEPWVRIPLIRVEADVLLFWALSCEVPADKVEATRAECQAYYRGVRFGAERAWAKYRAEEKKLLARK